MRIVTHWPLIELKPDNVEQLTLEDGTLLLDVLTGVYSLADMFIQPVSPLSPIAWRARPVSAPCPGATGPFGVLKVFTAPMMRGPVPPQAAGPAQAGFP